MTLTVQVSTGSGSITNAAALTSTTPDPTPGNNTSTTVTSRNDSADLASPRPPASAPGTVGQTFSYVITFDNAGPSAAANVTPLTDALVGLTPGHATNSVGTLQTSSAALTVTLAQPGQRVPAAPSDPDRAGPTGSGSDTNAAALTSTTPDPTLGNNNTQHHGDQPHRQRRPAHHQDRQRQRRHRGPDLQLCHHLRQRRAECSRQRHLTDARSA